ncbi:MAG TPA: PD-(D/E)XK nuclease family protein [Candidatus Saccharimonadales bacterium]|nr:PD-(D/E)XK nuclease family protein [Candidatus Saccharimonadales bacterium]
MSQLTIALADGNETAAAAIWPEVLSYDFWGLPTEKIWRLNWESRQSHQPLTAALLNDIEHSQIATFFLRLAAVLPTSTLEEQLDALIGLPETKDNLKLPITSPLYNHYFSRPAAGRSPLQFTKLISDLNVLRARLRDYRRSRDAPLGLRAFLEFSQGHRAAKLNVLNTSPYHETDDAVNLLTAYGAKGREFRAVFVIAALDEVWGSASRNQGYRLALPTNLAHIRYQGASEDERLRLLFVAATRAVDRLYFCSYSQDLAGKPYTALKYLSVQESADGQLASLVLPPRFQAIKLDQSKQLPPAAAADYWQARHLPPLKTGLKQVLGPVLARYQLSATHLNQFTDIVNGGPAVFFMQCLLSFPSAPSLTNVFGTAIHNSLRSAGHIFIREGSPPSLDRLLEIFEAQLSRIELPADEMTNLNGRGRAALKAWLGQAGQQLKPADRFEYDFSGEGAHVADARLAGRIDRLAIDEKTKQITVFDYKTGQSYSRWQSGVIKLHKFRQQLLFYKLLVENSARFRGYRVNRGVVEFVEPDEAGKLNSLGLSYEEADVQAMVRLITNVWQRIQSLDFPDTSTYAPSIAGIRQFETDLEAGKSKTAG